MHFLFLNSYNNIDLISGKYSTFQQIDFARITSSAFLPVLNIKSSFACSFNSIRIGKNFCRKRTKNASKIRPIEVCLIFSSAFFLQVDV